MTGVQTCALPICDKNTQQSVLPSVTLGTAYSLKILMTNNSLLNIFCQALGKDFTEYRVNSRQKKKNKVWRRRKNGNGGFAECPHGKTIGKDSLFAECQIRGTRQDVFSMNIIPLFHVVIAQIQFISIKIL